MLLIVCFLLPPPPSGPEFLSEEWHHFRREAKSFSLGCVYVAPLSTLLWKMPSGCMSLQNDGVLNHHLLHMFKPAVPKQDIGNARNGTSSRHCYKG